MIQNSGIKRSEVFEKVILRNGRLFRVQFVILERGGKLRGRVLSCEAIETLAGAETFFEGICLPSISFVGEAPLSRKLFEIVASPYFTLDFLTSIMVRAPARMI